MDNYTTVRKYTSRRSTPHRRHTRIPPRGGLRRLLAFQTLVCVILLLIIIIAKSISTAPADFITGQVRYVLGQNIELKSIYTFAQNAVSDIRNSIIQDSENGVADLTAAAKDSSIDTDKDELAYQTNEGNQINQSIQNEDSLKMQETSVLIPETSVLAASSGDVDAYTSDQPGVLGFISPANGLIAIPFGEITRPGGVVMMHKGIDISVEHRSDVKAALDGIVADSGSAPGYGDFIKLEHDNGLTTIYGNCSSIAVKINDSVKKGYVIAEIGEDSMTGGHLHFEVWHGNNPVDPLDYISVAAG